LKKLASLSQPIGPKTITNRDLLRPHWGHGDRDI